MTGLALEEIDDSVHQLSGQSANPAKLFFDPSQRKGFRLPAGLTTAIRRRVAAALDVNPNSIEVERNSLGISGSALRCAGRSNARRFDAKIYLVNQVPVHTSFPLPGEDVGQPAGICRPVEDQIIIEWRRIQQMRSLVGSRNCPAPMGYTLEGRTLVLEAVNGLQADRLADRVCLLNPRLRSVENALFHAGAWLKNLHQVSSRRWETVYPIDVLAQGHRAAELRLSEPNYNRRLSLQPLEAACRQIGPRTPIRVTNSLNQGDFSLGNLLWDGKEEHLWIVDFGLASYRLILHDLSTIVFDLRSRLFYPFASLRGIHQLEESFWNGYGSVAANVRMLVNAMVTHRLFDQYLPGIPNSLATKGFRGRIWSFVFKRLVQPFMVSRVLRAC
jgi:hypothetical protein